MNKKPRTQLGQTAALVRARKHGDTPPPIEFRRKLVADLCKLLGDQLPTPRRPATEPETVPLAAAEPKTDAPADSALPPRLRQTLEYLLTGDSEKQIARKLALSQHTVHVYVKSLYRRFDVNSRGELLARWVKR